LSRGAAMWIVSSLTKARINVEHRENSTKQYASGTYPNSAAVSTNSEQSSSHAAGAMERIIRIIRSHLRHVLNEQVLSEESFQTLVVECESIANFRPLTAASENVDDFRAICPNDLLLVRPSQSLPPGNFPEDVRFVRQWKQVQGLANSF